MAACRALLIVPLFMLLAACKEEPPAAPIGQAPVDAGPAVTQLDVHPGQQAYFENCAECHEAAVYKAPSRRFLAMLGPANVLRSMEAGVMQEQAAGLDYDMRRHVAEFVTGQSLIDTSALPLPPACGQQPGFDPAQLPVSLGFGVDLHQTRFAPLPQGGLGAEAMAKLEVKWAFAYPHAIQARSQPTFGGGAIYFGSQDGTVWALDARTGCLRWTFKANGEVRNAIVISPWTAEDADPQPTLYFADIVARVYAVDARSGELRWSAKVDEHPDATVTGSVSLHDGRLYVPVSSLEVVAAMDPQYACCTFRGAVVALDAATGEQIWKAHTIDEPPSPAGKSRVGTDILAASGAPVWNSPTIDAKRGRLYVGTGENYSSPADDNSDAIIAFDLATGAKLWVSQQTEGDAWNVACLTEYTSDNSNCPEENGPDYDFGASPMLITLDDGRELVVGGQKSGGVMGIDPDTGETLWRTQVGRGGVQGGIHFGMAAEGQRIFVPINDMAYDGDVVRYAGRDPNPGLYALDAATGELLWSAPATNQCGNLENCDPGISHAISAVPGAVLAGYLDGRLRVHHSGTGEVLWELDTLAQFDTVSGQPASGGSFSGGGALVANGMVYVNSGYGLYGHMPGNLLLALGPKDGE